MLDKDLRAVRDKLEKLDYTLERLVDSFEGDTAVMDRIACALININYNLESLVAIERNKQK